MPLAKNALVGPAQTPQQARIAEAAPRRRDPIRRGSPGRDDAMLKRVAAPLEALLQDRRPGKARIVGSREADGCGCELSHSSRLIRRGLRRNPVVLWPFSLPRQTAFCKPSFECDPLAVDSWRGAPWRSSSPRHSLPRVSWLSLWPPVQVRVALQAALMRAGLPWGSAAAQHQTSILSSIPGWPRLHVRAENADPPLPWPSPAAAVCGFKANPFRS